MTKEKNSGNTTFPHNIHTYKPYYAEVEVFDRDSENPAHKYSIKTSDEKYATISEDEKFVFELMDGEKTLDELALLFMEEKGRIALTMIQNLTFRLWREGILTDPERIEVDSESEFIPKSFQLNLPGLNKVGNILYPLLGLPLLNTFSMLLMVIAGFYGTYALSQTYNDLANAKPLFTYNNDPASGLAIMLLTLLAAALVRFIGLSMAHRKYKININSAGLTYSKGFLGLYVDAPGIIILKSGQRFWLRISGLLIVFAISGILFGCSALEKIAPESSLLLFQVGFYLLLYCIFHCCPVINSDLYLACSDYLDEHFLRRSSINFVTSHIKSFFKPVKNQSDDNVIYIMFCAGVLLWIAGTAQLLLSALSQNSLILSGIFNSEQNTSTFILLSLILLPIFTGFSLCAFWLYRLFVQTVTSIPIFQTSRNMVLLASLLTFIFLMLVRISDVDTRKILYILLIISTAGTTFYHALKFSKLQKKSPYLKQFYFLAIFALIFIISASANFMAPNSDLTWITTILLALSALCFSIMNIPIDWSEFISHKRDTFITSAALIICTALLWVVNQQIVTGFANNMTLLENASASHLSASRTTGIMTFLILGLSLLLNIPAIVYRRRTENFAPFFVIVFCIHLIIYFTIISISGRHDITLWESLTTVAILLLISTESHKICHLNQHKEIISYPIIDSENEKQSLITGFQYIIDSLFDAIDIDFGNSRTDYIKRNFNKYAEKMQWGWAIENIPKDDANINTLGDTYKNAFDKIRQYAYFTCGQSYTDNLLYEIEDNLHVLAKQVINDRVTQLKSDEVINRQKNLSSEDKKKLIKETVLFNGLNEEHIDQLINCLHSHTYGEGDLIIKQYDEGDRLYILVEGKAQVEVEDMARNSQIVSYLSNHEFFGEIALLTSSERTASVRACTDTTVLYLKRKDFDAFLDLNPDDKDHIVESLNYLRLIKTIPLFKDLDSSLINTFTRQMSKEEFTNKDEIITQGEIGDKFYIILDGECRVHVNREDEQDHEVATLSQGEYFGEIALLKDIPRTASVSALTDKVTVLSLLKNDFLSAVQSHEPLASDFNNASNRRIVEMMH